jgi:hypothetical protein
MTMISSLVLMSVLILAVASFAVMGDGLSLFKFAYAQTPDPGANPDPTAGDNFTDMGMPGDNSTDPSMPSDNSTDMSSAPIDPSAGLGMPADNSTDISSADNMTSTTSNSASNATVPEFGPLASIVLVFSVLSILVFSAKAKLKF